MKNTQALKTRIKLLFLSLCILNSFTITVNAQGDTPNEVNQNTPAGVTQPKIIPVEGQQLYLPHDQSNQGNKAYVQNTLLPGIASTIIGMIGAVALLFVILSGIQYLTAFGDPEKANKAKSSLMWALIGVVIAGLSYAIVAIIASINIGSL